MVLEAKNVHWSVNEGTDVEFEILKGVSISVDKGEFVSIVGASGSGKSSFLNCLSGLTKPTSGEVEILDVDPYSLKSGELAKMRRRHIGFIFQEYNLVPSLSAYENAVFPLLMDGKSVSKGYVYDLLRRLEFKANPENSVEVLSGGEQQKVAIARVLLTDCQVIFADEPTGAVDSKSRDTIMGMLEDLVDMGKTLVMVTHDLELAARADRSYVMEDGLIIDEIVNPTLEQLLSSMKMTV